MVNLHTRVASRLNSILSTFRSRQNHSEMTRIFLTGASGYVGGDVLHTLQKTHPEYAITILVRDSHKGEKISQAYPNVKVILGDLDSASLLEEEVGKADIVVHAASAQHIKSVETIGRALEKRNSSKPAYWIQISGASLLSALDIETGSYGKPSETKYSDLDDIQGIKELIHRYSAKRLVDKFILDFVNSKSEHKVAAVYPPIIYGSGRGPVNQRSVQIPELARLTLQSKTGVQIGQGLSTWSNVHISDISQIFLRLVENAANGTDGPFWNENGIYFAENGAINFAHISKLVTQEAHKLGLVESATAVKQISHEEADSLSGHASVVLGTNAQEKAQRARRYLGWNPTGISLEEEIPNTVHAEASRLGLL